MLAHADQGRKPKYVSAGDRDAVLCRRGRDIDLFEPMLGSAPEKRVAETAVIDDTRTPVQTPVRVVGAPFEPNVNPRQR
ncbi:hypothetical protein BwSH20_25560 [Bradyrhizobium ottawaense]|nr:hypothetical protein SG09_65350 [Bradyrhizobium ottawaense]GMO33341.1 hypothetical protein BwSF21_37700 [Bradyrhizobium ottawaense]GMO43273.1 hypothetical protein BwSH14_56050 [Bradyrhizobium ottawaense]GMO47439.1 hypothetical protein BwSF12_53940 [Bradyrhizobium ottawaense]GMO66196.1 hypothetical protein BwSH17_18300 [Bradyrhizobium ottawaense]